MTAMTSHKQCYGTMFHDSLQASTNQQMTGKVFGFELHSQGLACPDRHVHINLAEWDKCRQCEEFDHCYKFCMAKLALETAISRQ